MVKFEAIKELSGEGSTKDVSLIKGYSQKKGPFIRKVIELAKKVEHIIT